MPTAQGSAGRAAPAGVLAMPGSAVFYAEVRPRRLATSGHERGRALRALLERADVPGAQGDLVAVEVELVDGEKAA